MSNFGEAFTKNEKEKINLEHDDAAFFFFFICLLTLIIIPLIY